MCIQKYTWYHTWVYTKKIFLQGVHVDMLLVHKVDQLFYKSPFDVLYCYKNRLILTACYWFTVLQFGHTGTLFLFLKTVCVNRLRQFLQRIHLGINVFIIIHITSFSLTAGTNIVSTYGTLCMTVYIYLLSVSVTDRAKVHNSFLMIRKNTPE
jgi:hypothetical protein